MGVFRLISDHHDDLSIREKVANFVRGGFPKGNPDPENFQILFTNTVGKYLITEVRYPNCSTYEGRKLLMYEGISEKELKSLKTLDPHFHSEATSPIARFEPTPRGHLMAHRLAELMSEGLEW